MKDEPLSAAEVLAWEEIAGRERPEAITREAAERAFVVPSFTVQGVDDGFFLRLAGPAGARVDVFFNAVLAVQLINTLCEIGHRAKWRNEDDGSLIVRDPQNLGHAGPKS